jgi:hypothetical protein
LTSEEKCDGNLPRKTWDLVVIPWGFTNENGDSMGFSGMFQGFR